MDKFILRKAEPKDVSDILRLIKVQTNPRRMRITFNRIIIIFNFKFRIFFNVLVVCGIIYAV